MLRVPGAPHNLGPGYLGQTVFVSEVTPQCGPFCLPLCELCISLHPAWEKDTSWEDASGVERRYGLSAKEGLKWSGRPGKGCMGSPSLSWSVPSHLRLAGLALLTSHHNVLSLYSLLLPRDRVDWVAVPLSLSLSL